jgi:hypothetical protein
MFTCVAMNMYMHVIEILKQLCFPKKTTGGWKLGRRGRGCDFSPVGVVVGGSGQVSRVWPWAGFCHTRPVAIPINDL